MTSNDDENPLELKYFNFLDKIKKEVIPKEDIKTFKKSRIDKKIKLKLRDNRVISLYNLKIENVRESHKIVTAGNLEQKIHCDLIASPPGDN